MHMVRTPLTAREKRLLICLVLMAAMSIVTDIPMVVETYRTVQAMGGLVGVWRAYELANSDLAKTPANPIVPPVPGYRPASQAPVYLVHNQSYLLKPNWQCGSGKLGLKFLNTDGRDVHYWDAGDRWIFESNGLKNNSSMAEPMVQAVCLIDIQVHPMTRPSLNNKKEV
jgi:hypothetical protein